jgi:hypothetical protein
MKQLALTLTIICACGELSYAGPAYAGKEMKEVAPAPCRSGTATTNGTLACGDLRHDRHRIRP